MKNNPVISVVTISYNAVATIEQTILSVFNQTYKNIEYIIIDGGSTDGTVDIIKKYADKITYWVSEPDKGIYDAMNKGIEKASGEWINFMNAGDCFYNESIINFIFEEKIKSDYKIIYGDVMLNDGKLMSIEKAVDPSSLKKRMLCCHQSIFFYVGNKTEIYYDCRYSLGADYNLLMNLYKQYGQNSFLYINIPISIFECTNGISSKSKNRVKREHLKIRLMHGSPYVILDILRYFKSRLKTIYTRWFKLY